MTMNNIPRCKCGGPRIIVSLETRTPKWLADVECLSCHTFEMVETTREDMLGLTPKQEPAATT